MDLQAPLWSGWERSHTEFRRFSIGPWHRFSYPVDIRFSYAILQLPPHYAGSALRRMEDRAFRPVEEISGAHLLRDRIFLLSFRHARRLSLYAFARVRAFAVQ